MFKGIKKIRFLFLFIFAGLSIAISANVLFGPDWQTADRSSVGIAPDPAVEAEAAGDPQLDELERLAALRDQGVITDEEFEAKKKQLLGL